MHIKSIGLSYTLTCPLSCRHCMPSSSPQTPGKMTLEQAQRYIPVIAEFSKELCFTGGEPLLFPREILELTRFATGLGLRVSLVTGAGWAVDDALVKRRVEDLVAAGLRHLVISWDVYHEEFSRREHAVNLARRGVEAGLEVAVRITNPPSVDRSAYQAAFEGLEVRLETSQTTRLGRASTLPPSHFQAQDSPPQGACFTIMSLVINHDGKVYACCGPANFSTPHSPLALGDAEREPLQTILNRAEQDPLLEVISLLGPYGLYTLLLQSDLKECYRKPEGFSSICDLCLDLTNESRFVAAIREQLQRRESQIMIAAARLWMKHRLGPEHAGKLGLQRRNPEPSLPVGGSL